MRAPPSAPFGVEQYGVKVLEGEEGPRGFGKGGGEGQTIGASHCFPAKMEVIGQLASEPRGGGGGHHARPGELGSAGT